MRDDIPDYHGPHREAVNEVLEFFWYEPLLFATAAPKHLQDRVEVVTGPPEWGWDTGTFGSPPWTGVEGEIAYRDIRDRMLGDAYTQHYSDGFTWARREMDSLLDSIRTTRFYERLATRLEPQFHDYLDWFYSDFYELIQVRAALGREGGIEWVFEIYSAGGWPVGWRGKWPLGKPLAVFPGNRILHESK